MNHRAFFSIVLAFHLFLIGWITSCKPKGPEVFGTFSGTLSASSYIQIRGRAPQACSLNSGVTFDYTTASSSGFSSQWGKGKEYQWKWEGIKIAIKRPTDSDNAIPIQVLTPGYFGICNTTMVLQKKRSREDWKVTKTTCKYKMNGWKPAKVYLNWGGIKAGPSPTSPIEVSFGFESTCQVTVKGTLAFESGDQELPTLPKRTKPEIKIEPADQRAPVTPKVQVVQDVLEKFSPLFIKGCYVPALKESPGIGGEARYSIMIDHRGKPVFAVPDRQKGDTEEVAKCIEKKIEALKFPKPRVPKGQSKLYYLTLVFLPPE